VIRRLFTRLLVRPEDLAPACDDFEVIGAFNPGVVRTGRHTILLIRVAERPRSPGSGFVDLPRWSERGLMVDRFRDEDVQQLDPRVVRIRETGLTRLTFVSHLRMAMSGDGETIDAISGPLLQPERIEEEYGVEDPRITPLDGGYQVTCVCVSRHGAATELLSTTDFQRFERRGIIFCPENKDVVLLPERIAGDYVALHRPNGATPFTRPEMWMARSPDLLHWGGHAPLNLPAMDWQTGRVGGGAPPVRLPEGWLEVYHANRRPARAGEIGPYFGAAVLLDADDPAVVRAYSPEAILAPTQEFETTGFAPGVVFPTGVVEADDVLLVYYGAADTCTAVAALSRAELLATLRSA
jgi:predicted GH43/DUF377 family glycosyl hydrolase